ncbi:unnamed protein product [Leptidea sinapis]|uniref:Uncharacterized protein n=1 Tax=Leptidea sinapis TaxID=189913 RepID=A0A5E4R604_9NEOP|nr:unnamed protein product [Leptidea sinapis]
MEILEDHSGCPDNAVLLLNKITDQCRDTQALLISRYSHLGLLYEYQIGIEEEDAFQTPTSNIMFFLFGYTYNFLKI